ncbi:hypothetical protein ACFQHW_04105 [Lapidilactobacillus achengensis]|uniref:Uncharacterized protein n=1 Tax=Lapidilactobacillus achengensis TaxID=2486000 RepID=A0ABW1ULC5_9LACO|nr:hypothetical protein [Lapidilactobacillus achengensis]
MSAPNIEWSTNTVQLIHPELARVHQTDCAGVTNLKLVITNHGRQLRGSSSIGHSLPVGGSAQATVETLSGWSGEIRGEIAVKLSLAALPLRTRPDFETSRVLCGLAQNSAHSELTPNFAAQAAANLLLASAPLLLVAVGSGKRSAPRPIRSEPSPSAPCRSAR